MTVATTDEITIGENCITPKSARMISSAKSAPATGALNVPAMPAAAPQPTSVRSRRSSSFSHCPMLEPKAEPIWTMGPSRPTEPPEAMLMAEANILARTTRGRMRPPRKATASITSRHAVALGLAREVIHDQRAQQAADGGDGDLPGGGKGTDVVERVRPVAPGETVSELDQASEPDRREAAAEPDQPGHEHHVEVLRLPQGGRGCVSVFSRGAGP